MIVGFSSTVITEPAFICMLRSAWPRMIVDFQSTVLTEPAHSFAYFRSTWPRMIVSFQSTVLTEPGAPDTHLVRPHDESDTFLPTLCSWEWRDR
jgi:hypothetical protein